MLDILDEKTKRAMSYLPLPKELSVNLDQWFAIELAYTSNALEGNTLTRQETALILEKGLTVGGKTLNEHLEAKNHAQALSFIKSLVNQPGVKEEDILHIHFLILNHIDDPNAGRYRTVPVRISGSTTILPNPLKVPELMAGFFQWLETDNEHPVKRAALAHYKLLTIHPFSDGNGRTTRLLMNLLLLQAGSPMAIISPVDRLAYINSLEMAQTGGSLDPFLRLIYQAVEYSLDIYLKSYNEII